MRRVGDELALSSGGLVELAHRPVERVEHPVERRRQPAELVPAGVLDPPAEVLRRGDVLGGVGQPPHRGEGRPGDEPPQHRREGDAPGGQEDQDQAQPFEHRVDLPERTGDPTARPGAKPTVRMRTCWPPTRASVRTDPDRAGERPGRRGHREGDLARRELGGRPGVVDHLGEPDALARPDRDPEVQRRDPGRRRARRPGPPEEEAAGPVLVEDHPDLAARATQPGDLRRARRRGQDPVDVALGAAAQGAVDFPAQLVADQHVGQERRDRHGDRDRGRRRQGDPPPEAHGDRRM